MHSICSRPSRTMQADLRAHFDPENPQSGPNDSPAPSNAPQLRKICNPTRPLPPYDPLIHGFAAYPQTLSYRQVLVQKFSTRNLQKGRKKVTKSRNPDNYPCKDWRSGRIYMPTGAYLSKEYTSAASCVVRIDDGRPETLRPRSWRRTPSLLPLPPRSPELVNQNSLFATTAVCSPSLRRRRPGGGNHSGERLGKRIMCAGLSLFPRREYPGCIHQLFHYRYLHPSTLFPPVSIFHPWQAPGGWISQWAPPLVWSLYRREGWTSTGTIHRPAIHSIIDPRPSKVRDPASTSYLTTGKFLVLKLPFHSPHVSSVGRSMRMWCHTRFHPSFIFVKGRMDERPHSLTLIIHRLSYHSIQVPLSRQSSTSHYGTCERRWWRTAGASDSFILLDLVSRHDKNMCVDEISQMDEKCIRNHVMMERTVLEMCLYKLTWVFGSEYVMQIIFVNVLCIKFLECVMQWHKVDPNLWVHTSISYKHCL